MTGVVLCGGQSTRMGSDKGLLLHDSVTWAQLAAAKLSALNIPVVLSVNHEQYNLYRTAFSSLVIVEDDAGLDIGGPLKGVLSVHRRYPNESLFILACDMVNMHTDALHHLIAQTSAYAGEEYVFINDNYIIENLCGIYTAAGLQRIIRQYLEGKLTKHSMRNLANILDTHLVPIPKAWISYFTNFNSPEDLRTS